MKTLLAIIAIILVIACSLESDEGGSNNQTTPSSSSEQTTPGNCSQNDKCYTVTVNNGVSCNVMIRKGSSSSHKYTLQCPSGTKIGCMRAYDKSDFILGTKSSYVGTTSFGLVAADGYGDGEIFINSNNGNFESIARVSLHETSCN